MVIFLRPAFSNAKPRTHTQPYSSPSPPRTGNNKSQSRVSVFIRVGFGETIQMLMAPVMLSLSCQHDSVCKLVDLKTVRVNLQKLAHAQRGGVALSRKPWSLRVMREVVMRAGSAVMGCDVQRELSLPPQSTSPRKVKETACITGRSELLPMLRTLRQP